MEDIAAVEHRCQLLHRVRTARWDSLSQAHTAGAEGQDCETSRSVLWLGFQIVSLGIFAPPR